VEYVYAISDGKNIKIGISKNPKVRRFQLSTGNAKDLYLLGYFEGDRALESYIHNRFMKARVNSEWMLASEELLDYLNSKLSDVFIMIVDDKVRALKKIKK
jgi:hypothetical protein